MSALRLPAITRSSTVGFLLALITFSYVLSGLSGYGGRGLLSGGLTLLLGALVVASGMTRPRVSSVDVLLVILGGLVLVRLVVGSAPAHGAAAQFIGLGLLPYALVRLTPHLTTVFTAFSRSLIGLTILSGIGVIAQWLGAGTEGIYRLGTESLNPNGLALVFGPSLVASVGVLTTDQARAWRALSVPAMIVALAVVGLSAMRSALVAAALAVTIILLSQGTWTGKSGKVLLFVVIGVGALFAASVFAPESAFVLRVVTLEDVASFRERELIYTAAMNEISARPVLGWGLGAFEMRHGVYPHNLLLDLFHSFGALGLGAFVGLGLMTVFFVGRALLTKNGVSPAFAITVSMLVFAMTVRLSSVSLAQSKDLMILLAMAITLRALPTDRGRCNER